MIIHYINHNFTDWDSQTKHMSRFEKSIFLDLRSMYFANATIQNGKIEASDFDLLCYRLSCNTDEEKNALTKILKDKFKKIGKTYRLAKWDYAIRCIAKKYGHTGQPLDNAMTDDVTHDVTGTDKLHENDVTKSRQQKSNEKKRHMIDLLKSVGIQSNTRMSITELTTLCDSNNISVHDNAMTDDVTHDVTGTDNDVTDIDGQIRDRTNNQKPTTNNQDKKQKLLDSVTEVFEFWKSVFDKNDQTKLSDTRKRKIEKRLEEDGYTVEQIKQAIFNCSKSDYHVTGNHIDLELICRSIEKMDYFLGLKHQTNQDRFGTANDPLAVNQVWGQKPSYTATQTYEDYMAEQEDKIARQNPTQSPAGYEEIL